MRWQSANLKFNLAILLLSHFLSGCETGLTSSDANAYRLPGYTNICDMVPADGTTNLPVDANIAITFDDILDGNSVNPDNVKIALRNGSAYGGVPIINHDPVLGDSSTPGCPQGKPLSRVLIAPGVGSYWAPGQEYTVLFSTRNAQTDSTSAQIIGMAAQGSGAPVQKQHKFFKITDNPQEFSSNRLDVISMIPGRIINRGGGSLPTTFATLGSDLVTNRARQPIQITFSEPFRQQAWDQTEQIAPIPPGTPLYDTAHRNGFLGVALGVVNSANQIASVVAALPNTITDPAAWSAAIRQVLNNNTLVATVSSSDRRSLLITPQEDYPTGLGQAVVVIIQGFVSQRTRQPQRQIGFVGTFFHVNDLNLSTNFEDYSNWGSGGGQ